MKGVVGDSNTEGIDRNWWYLVVYAVVAVIILVAVGVSHAADLVLVGEVLGLLALGVIEIVTHQITDERQSAQWRRQDQRDKLDREADQAREAEKLLLEEQSKPRLIITGLTPQGEPSNSFFTVGIKNSGKRVAVGCQAKVILNGIDVYGVPLRRGLMWESTFTRFAWKVDIPPEDDEPAALVRAEPHHDPPVLLIAPPPRVSGDPEATRGENQPRQAMALKGVYSGGLVLSAENVEAQLYPLSIVWEANTVRVSIRLSESQGAPAMAAEAELDTGNYRYAILTAKGPATITIQAHPVLEGETK